MENDLRMGGVARGSPRYDPQGPILSIPQRERKQNVLNSTGISEEKSSWFIELESW